MKIVSTSLADVLIVEPRVFGDERGFFYESFNEKRFHELTGIAPKFVQDNHSRSVRNVLRGLHYQLGRTQAKLVRVVSGEVFDVAVDLRRSSPTFGQWTGVLLSAENKRQLWVPAGFAHGFVVTSDAAEVLYKITDYWFAEHEHAIAWNDPDIAIAWPQGMGEPLLSERDRKAGSLANARVFD